MAGRVIAGAFGKPKKPKLKAEDLKDPKRKEANVKTEGKQTQISRNEVSIKGGGKTPAQLSKQYAREQIKLKKIIDTSKSPTLVAAAKKALKALDKKAEAELGKNVRKMQAGRKLPKGKREPSKPAMPFNKGGMVKKNHAKPGSYSKAYMKGGMATDMRKTGMFKGGYSTKKK